MKKIIFTVIGVIGICLLVLLSVKISQKSPTPTGNDTDTGILEASPDVFVNPLGEDMSPDLLFSDPLSGIAEDDYKNLTIIVYGNEVIRFQPDKKIIGMDGRVIGYLNNEEVELLKKFWE